MQRTEHVEHRIKRKRKWVFGRERIVRRDGNRPSLRQQRGKPFTGGRRSASEGATVQVQHHWRRSGALAVDPNRHPRALLCLDGVLHP